MIRRRSAAFTLVEMLVVISIIGILMGVGVGAYIGMNRELSFSAAVTSVTSMMQAARNSATVNRTPVSFVMKMEPVPAGERILRDVLLYTCKEMYATFVTRVATWHFDPSAEELADTQHAITEVSGGTSQKATSVTGEPLVFVPGKFGKALQFSVWPDETEAEVRQALQCGASPAWDLREGLRISAWVCPDAPPAGETAVYYPVVARPLAEKPAYALTLFREGDDLGQEMLRVAGSVTVIAADGKQHLLETLSGLVVPCNTWTKVSMEYSRSAIDDAFTFVRLLVNDEPASEPVCLVDDVPTDGGSYSGLIATSAEQLMIGTDKTDFFHGSIDEVTIDAIESSGRQVPPGNVQFSANTGNVVDGLYWITFDGAGRLEQWWEDPLPILAIYSPGSKTALLVGVELTGSIKTWRVGSDYAADEMTKWQQGDAQQNP